MNDAVKNLNYLTVISIISLGSLVFLAGNTLLDIKMIDINRLECIGLLEEKNPKLPFLLWNYYKDLINLNKNKFISLYFIHSTNVHTWTEHHQSFKI